MKRKFNLKKSKKDILYEIDMFRKTSDNLMQQKELLLYIKNALIESFAIHSRNLYIFFYTKIDKRIKDDIIAEDYIKNKKLFIVNRTPKKELAFIPNKTAKQIAHLTYHRIVYNKRTKLWPVKKIRNKMEKTIQSYFNASR